MIVTRCKLSRTRPTTTMAPEKGGVVVKTLHTPVFFATPQSSPPSSRDAIKTMPKLLTSYLDRLSSQHLALAQLFDEVPPLQDPSSDFVDGSDVFERTKRVEALRLRILEAVNQAYHDPAHGKWFNVSQLVRMGCTRGRRRWLGTSLDPPSKSSISEPPVDGWPLVETEEEWMQWHKRYEKEKTLKWKVETWQQGLRVEEDQSATIEKIVVENEDEIMEGPSQRSINVEPELPKRTSRLTKDATPNVRKQGKLGRTSTARDFKDQPQLGFTVAKRSSALLAAASQKAKPKPQPRPRQDASGSHRNEQTKPSSPQSRNIRHEKRAQPSPNAPAAGPSKPSPRSSNKANISSDVVILSDTSKSSPHKRIEDLSDLTFFPPSFPSHLDTSTPVAQRLGVGKSKLKSKVPAIQASASSPLLCVRSPSPPCFSSSQDASRSIGREPIRSSSSLPFLPSTPTRPRPTRLTVDASPRANKDLKTASKQQTAPLTHLQAPHSPQNPIILAPPSSSPSLHEDPDPISSSSFAARAPSYGPTVSAAERSTPIPGHAPESYLEIDSFSMPTPALPPSANAHHLPEVPSTPKRITSMAGLPTLTELLATSRKRKAMATTTPRARAGASPKRFKAAPTPARDKPEPKPSVAPGRSKDTTPLFSKDPTPEAQLVVQNGDKGNGGAPALADDADDLFAPEKNRQSPAPRPLFMSARTRVGAAASYEDIYGMPMEVDDDLASPAKSMSSLAGSDSEEDDANDYIPGFTQTPNGEDAFAVPKVKLGATDNDAEILSQESGMVVGSQADNFGGVPFGVYNSQFDVEGEVGRVNELLEKDVDFDGWLRDVSGDEMD
ncbi:hypothetical protein HGRIS_013909 [Hohenbuehelia grisea]|uniref:Uncharacterized protein n=1 Tax=Hohenbuehelia grisea TaxID=104357 RepID=A0ABR3IX64_9AGAR